MSHTSLLEQSLDDIIGSNKANRPSRGKGSSNRTRREGKGRIGKTDRRQSNNRFKSSRPKIPHSIISLSHGRPLLRVKNVHSELTGQDLSQLFGEVAPVEFVKFDPDNDSHAYVCFESNNAKYNSIAISKYDGRKAMGRTLVVENAQSLADRIVVPSRGRLDLPRSGSQHAAKKNPRGKNGKNNSKPREKPVKKSVEDLDDELSAYMSGQAAPQAQVSESVPSESTDASATTDATASSSMETTSASQAPVDSNVVDEAME